jgi:hypothetical protein
MLKLIPILIIFLPFCLIVSNGFCSSDKPFWKALETGLLLIVWLYILLCLSIIQQCPVASKFIIGIVAFVLPLYLAWKSAALQLFSQYVQRAKWAFSAAWTTIWYLLFDHTGLGLITWIVVWPIVLFMLWKAYSAKTAFHRPLFMVIRKYFSFNDKD